MTATTSTPARTTGGLSAVPRDLPGLLLARITVLPALAALFFLLAAFPLLLIGEFKPVPVIAAGGLAIVVGVPLSARRVRVPIRDTPAWAPIAIGVIAIGFFLFQIHYRSGFVIATRDPAAYMQFATWIAKHGSVPIPESLPGASAARSTSCISIAPPTTRWARRSSRSSWRPADGARDRVLAGR